MAIVRDILIDTNVYVAFRRADQRVLDVLRIVETIALCPVVTAELLSGFRGGNKESGNRAALEAFMATPRVRPISINHTTSEHYSRIYDGLRARGRPIPTNDMWIAACSVQHGLALYSLDDHFAGIGGLLIHG